MSLFPYSNYVQWLNFNLSNYYHNRIIFGIKSSAVCMCSWSPIKMAKKQSKMETWTLRLMIHRKCRWNKIEKLNTPARVQHTACPQTHTHTHARAFWMCFPRKHIRWFYAFKSSMNFKNMLTKLIGRFVCQIYSRSCFRVCSFSTSHTPHMVFSILVFVYVDLNGSAMRLIYDYCRTNIQMKYSPEMYVPMCKLYSSM